MRFMPWQQALVIISFAAMLLAYVFFAYRVLSGPRPLRSTVKRLIGTLVLGSIGWFLIGKIISMIASANLDYYTGRRWLVDNAIGNTFGFPFGENVWDFLYSIGVPYGLIPYVIVATIPIVLLVLAELVIIADRLLIERPFSLHAHRREAAAGLIGVVILGLAVPLWPQPDRNPAMAYIAIPADAVDVKYSILQGVASAPPLTTFSTDVLNQKQLQDYYKTTLEADGWQFSPDPAFALAPETWIYTKAGRYLELNLPRQYYGTYVTLTLWRNSQEMYGYHF